MIANGWFIRVKSFAYSPGVGSISSRFALAASRWLVFLAFWAAALAWLPMVLVGLAFAGWAAWIARDIRRVLGAMDVQEELVSEQNAPKRT